MINEENIIKGSFKTNRKKNLYLKKTKKILSENLDRIEKRNDKKYKNENNLELKNMINKNIKNIINHYNSEIKNLNKENKIIINTIIKDKNIIEIEGKYKKKEIKYKNINLLFNNIKINFDFIKFTKLNITVFDKNFNKIKDLDSKISQKFENNMNINFNYKENKLLKNKNNYIIIYYFTYDENFESSIIWGRSIFKIKNYLKYSYFELPIYLPQYLWYNINSTLKNYKKFIRLPFCYLNVINKEKAINEQNYKLKKLIKFTNYENKSNFVRNNSANLKIDMKFYSNKIKNNISNLFKYNFLNKQIDNYPEIIIYLDNIHFLKNLKLSINIFILQGNNKKIIHKNIKTYFEKIILIKFQSNNIKLNNNKCIFLDIYSNNRLFGWCVIPCYLKNNNILFGRYGLPIVKNLE